jgi:cell division protease FtsH
LVYDESGKKERRMEFDDDAPRKEETRPRRPRSFLLLLILVFVAITLLYTGRTAISGDRVVEVSIEEYFELKNGGNVKEVWIEDDELTAELSTTHQKGGKEYRKVFTTVPEWYLKSHEGLQLSKGLDAAKFHYRKKNLFWYQVVLPFVPWIILILIVWYFFFRQIRATGGPGNILSFGKSRARFVTADKVKTTFADVAGVEEAKEEVGEIVEFLKNPQKFTRLGGRIPRGILLVGAPGTGKTLLAKAIAGEAGVPFLSISGSDFVEMFVGVGASRVRDLFRQAKENSPCIIFLDEIDAVGRRRGTGLGGGHDEREQTLNQILVEMDGFDTDEGIIMMAATNRPDVLDPALLRPGRFDRQVAIDLPDVKGREEILKIHARKIKLSRDVELKLLARATPMFSGADLASLVNEAAILATMRRKDAVEMSDLEEARDKVLWGRQKKSRVVVEEEKKIAAYHESGHALVACLQPECDPIHKVTIIPRGRAGGATMSLPERDRYMLSKRYCLAQITQLFGGRVAEEIVFPDISSGAQDDIRKATELARRMICEWGMSETMGPISYSEEEEHLFLGREIARTRNHSEAIASRIDAELRRIVDECYQKTRDLIGTNPMKLEAIAQALLKYESLTGDEVRALVRGESIDAAKDRDLAEERAREERAGEDVPPRKEPRWKGGDEPLPGPQQA